jgi:hypothetical protein
MCAPSTSEAAHARHFSGGDAAPQRGCIRTDPAADDRFYRAIREDDLATLRALVRDRGVETKDAQGQTP